MGAGESSEIEIVHKDQEAERLHSNIAANLSEVMEVPITPKQVIPVLETHPLEDATHEVSRVESEEGVKEKKEDSGAVFAESEAPSFLRRLVGVRIGFSKTSRFLEAEKKRLEKQGYEVKVKKAA